VNGVERERLCPTFIVATELREKIEEVRVARYADLYGKRIGYA
jgi:hypothetical protein